MRDFNLEDFLNKEVFEKIHNLYEEILEKNRDGDTDNFDRIKHYKYSIFYSNPLHTLKKGDIYFLGLNPKGKYSIIDVNQSEYYCDNDLSFYKNSRVNWCSLIDEYWGQNNSFDKLQKRIKQVLEFVINEMKLSISVREIFSSNINFFRSEDDKELFRIGIPFDICWSYHKKFLEIVKPRIIICNGFGESNTYTKSPFSIIKDKLEVKTCDQQIGLKAQNHIKFFKKNIGFLNCERETLIIGIEHLSRYSPADSFFCSLRKILNENI
jgi:hypothetical protein